MNDPDRRTQLATQLDDAARKLTTFQELPVVKRALDEVRALQREIDAASDLGEELTVRVRALTMQATWLVTLETRKTSVVSLGTASPPRAR